MDQLMLNIQIEKKQESELTPEELRLLEEAKAATLRSYSPYSKFAVGAAVLLDGDIVVCGSNQENAAYPSGICAERTSVFYANSAYPDRAIRMLCIAARDSSRKFTQRPISPCGACRQVLVESEKRFLQPIRIMLYGMEGIYILQSAADLLPVNFDSSYL